MRVLTLTVFWAALLLLPILSHAEGGEGGDSPEPTQSAAAHTKSKKAVEKREKETDGTTAPNRFEADTVIKSQYKHEGEQLEVDPD
jgi:hypothetical protein